MLADELRADGVEGLTEAQCETLAAALEAARRRQAAALDAAAERGLSFVPRLLRGPVKKLIL